MNNNTKPGNFVANYELNEYRYSNFWEGRQYEHLAEVTLLKKLFSTYLPDLSTRTVMDLGGAYGRLAPLYEATAKKVILADYSTSELLEGAGRVAQSSYKEKFSFLAMNAYKFPLKDDSLDSLLSVRVMHHLRDISLFWEELYRVLSPGGVAIIEFANKNHILAVFRHLAKLDIFSYVKQEILQVSHKSSSQGMKEGQISIMYNFAPDYIRRMSITQGFEIQGMFACSFLRMPLLKKLLPATILAKIENFLQIVFGKLLITPSVFVVLKKKGEFVSADASLNTLLRCPTCKSEIFLGEKNEYVCKNKHVFIQEKVGIIDLRDPRPEEVTF